MNVMIYKHLRICGNLDGMHQLPQDKPKHLELESLEVVFKLVRLLFLNLS